MAIDLTKIYDDIIEKSNILAERIRQYSEQEFVGVAKQTNEEFGVYQQELIKEIFDDAVRAFYEDYEPAFYGRRFSLYESLDLKTNQDGMVSGTMVGDSMPDYMGLFDRTVPVDRKGGSLFDTVFVEGWHGGAKYIASHLASKWGAHPSPGTPYYRKGGMLRGSNGRRYYFKYAKWGRRAERTGADESPYQIIYRELQNAEKGIMPQRRKMIFEDKCSEMDKRVAEKSISLMDEIFG